MVWVWKQGIKMTNTFKNADWGQLCLVFKTTTLQSVIDATFIYIKLRKMQRRISDAIIRALLQQIPQTLLRTQE
jgi:hypothetical protein